MLSDVRRRILHQSRKLGLNLKLNRSALCWRHIFSCSRQHVSNKQLPHLHQQPILGIADAALDCDGGPAKGEVEKTVLLLRLVKRVSLLFCARDATGKLATDGRQKRGHNITLEAEQSKIRRRCGATRWSSRVFWPDQAEKRG